MVPSYFRRAMKGSQQLLQKSGLEGGETLGCDPNSLVRIHFVLSIWCLVSRMVCLTETEHVDNLMVVSTWPCWMGTGLLHSRGPKRVGIFLLQLLLSPRPEISNGAMASIIGKWKILLKYKGVKRNHTCVHLCVSLESAVNPSSYVILITGQLLLQGVQVPSRQAR